MIIVAGDSNHDPKYSGYRKNNITVWTDKLNVKVDNIAESGVGNDVICDNTLKAIREHDYKVDHVYVFWSDWYRVYKEQNRNHDVEAYRKWQTDIVHGRLNADLETLINLNLKTFYTLQTALKESNIDYTFYQELNPLPMIEYEQEMFATKFIFNHPLFDFIDKDRFWGWPILRFIGGKNLYDRVKLDDLTDTDSHYGQKTHDHYAEFIIQKGMDL